MKLLLAIAVVVAALALEKFIRFLFAGGSLTQPARNATLLYRQIRIVYDRMPERQARFMALFLNSSSARSQISEDLLRDLVSKYDSRSWEDLCVTYTWLYASFVGHVDCSRLPLDLHASRTQKILEQIKFANFAVDHGDRRNEGFLRSLSQADVMMIVAKTDHPFP